MTARVRFAPLGLVALVPPGTTVLEAARAVGAPLGSACRGDGICGRCGVRVRQGAAPPEGELERRTKRANRVDPELRLACLLPVEGEFVVSTDYW